MAAAYTRLADILEPAVWLNYEKEYLPELFDLVGSNCVASPPESVASQMTAGGSIIDMPFWQESTHSEPKVMSDDPSAELDTKKITSGEEKARKLYWAEGWAQADLAGVIATGSPKDPLAQIADFIISYWRSAQQNACINVLDGLYADNVANDSSDMLYSVYSDTASPAASNKISFAAQNGARATMGENFKGLGTIIMHSKVYFDALNQEEITFVQPSNLPFQISMFGGMQVVISDSVTTVAGVNATKYRSYIMGPGALGMTVHLPDMAQEERREPGQGNGAGVTKVYSRRHALIHPRGFKWTETSVAGKSPTYAELATAGNWDRVRSRNNIKIAYLETN